MQLKGLFTDFKYNVNETVLQNIVNNKNNIISEAFHFVSSWKRYSMVK